MLMDHIYVQSKVVGNLGPWHGAYNISRSWWQFHCLPGSLGTSDPLLFEGPDAMSNRP